MPCCAPVSTPARIIPSITRCGRCVRMKRSLNVPGSLSSALQTMYFSGPGAWRTNCHFDSVGNPAPPSPRRPEAFSVSNVRSPIPRLHQPPAPPDTVHLRRRDRTRSARGDATCAISGNAPSRQNIAHDRRDLILRKPRVNVFVDRHRRSLIAPAQAGNSADSSRPRTRLGGTLRPDPRATFARAAKMARHILANAHIRFGRRRQMKMGIKTGDAVQAIQRHINFFGERLQLIGGQIAELALNIPAAH